MASKRLTLISKVSKIVLSALFLTTVIGCVCFLAVSESGFLRFIPMNFFTLFTLYAGVTAVLSKGLFVFFIIIFALILALFYLPLILLNDPRFNVVKLSAAIIFSVILLVDVILLVKLFGFGTVMVVPIIADAAAIFCAVFLAAVRIVEEKKKENGQRRGK